MVLILGFDSRLCVLQILEGGVLLFAARFVILIERKREIILLEDMVLH